MCYKMPILFVGKSMSLANQRVLLTGGSRGIGREIAIALAKQGASIALCAKSSKPHPKLEGTIHTVAEEVEAAGGQALALEMDVRDEDRIKEVVGTVNDTFGGIDILINNAGAIWYAKALDTPAKRLDLMLDINCRAAFLLGQACYPFLKKGNNPHILNLSPPISLKPKWFSEHLGYTISKYGMSMVTIGLAEEFKSAKIAVNSLWPKTTIATDAIRVNFPKPVYMASRKPTIIADAAIEILQKDSQQVTGNFFIDEAVLRDAGVTDFGDYAVNKLVPLWPDLFIEE